MTDLNKIKSHGPQPPKVIGAGLIVLDIILDNGSKTPIFDAGGTCGNVLAGLSFLGWQSKSISRAGKDVASDIMIEDLLTDGVDVDYISREKKLNTPRIVEKVNSNGFYAKHHFFLRCPSCNSYLPRFRSPTLDSINDILQTETSPEVFFFDRVTPSTLKLAKEYRKNGALIFFEPSNLKRLEEWEEVIGLSHVLKFSNSLTVKDVKLLINDTTILEKIKAYRPELIIQTLGKHGLLYSYPGEDKWRYKKGKELKKVYDTCGAGDWLTVGFLFYLHQKARENRIKLIETLGSIEFVKTALDFSQMLASLSSMFVGARGLSKRLKKNEILNITEDYMKKNPEVISPLEFPPNSKTRVGYIVGKELSGGGVCPTCLLYK